MNKKKLFPLALVPLAATALQAQSKVQTELTGKRPNIILFMVDDMGWQDTSVPFADEKTLFNNLYETPNSGRKRHTITNCTRRLIWNVLPGKV